MRSSDSQIAASRPTSASRGASFLAAAGGSAVGLCLGLESSQRLRGAPDAGRRARVRRRRSSPPISRSRRTTTVRIVTPELEFGQGMFTSLPLILADELGADWERVEVRQSWADERFINPLKGIQATGRSMSVRGQYDLLRKLGATARVLLCQAAAHDVGRGALPTAPRARARSCTGRARRRGSFGSLVAAGGGAARARRGDAPARRRADAHRSRRAAQGRAREGHRHGRIRRRRAPAGDARRHHRARARSSAARSLPSTRRKAACDARGRGSGQARRTPSPSWPRISGRHRMPCRRSSAQFCRRAERSRSTRRPCRSPGDALWTSPASSRVERGDV